MRLLLTLFSQGLLLLTVWLLWPRELDSYLVGIEGRKSVPEYAMKNARYVSVNQGKLEIEGYAEDASFDLKRKILQGKETKFFFYSEAQEKTTVWSNEADYLMELRRANLRGNVRSEAADGFTMRSSEAYYQTAQRLLTVPKPVEGESKDRSLKIWGDHADTQLDDKKVNLVGNARAEYVDKKEGLTKIRGDKAVLDREAERADFDQKVKVEQGKVVGTSDHGKILFDRKAKGMHYLSLIDDVKVQDETGRYSRSQLAEFYSPTDTIVLSGFPSVYDKEDVVTGDKITLFRSTGVVEVSAANAAGSSKRPELNSKQPSRHTDEDDELIP